jgi:hypothetical protein
MSGKGPTNILIERVTRSLFIPFLCSILIAVFAHVSGAEFDNKVIVLKNSDPSPQLQIIS